MKFNTDLNAVTNSASLGERGYRIRETTRLSWREIGTQLGVSATWAQQKAVEWARANAALWPLPGPPKAGHAPLTMQQKGERYHRYMKGTSFETIAADEGVLVEAVIKSIKKYAKELKLPYPHKSRV